MSLILLQLKNCQDCTRNFMRGHSIAALDKILDVMYATVANLEAEIHIKSYRNYTCDNQKLTNRPKFHNQSNSSLLHLELKTYSDLRGDVCYQNWLL